MIYTFPQITFRLTQNDYCSCLKIIKMDESLRGCDQQIFRNLINNVKFCIFESTNGWMIASIYEPYINTTKKIIYLQGTNTPEDHRIISFETEFYNNILFALKEWQTQIKIRRTEDILKEWI